MQIVIDIPKDEYNKICSGNFDTDGYFKMNLKEAFRNAILLPKGHGDLKDADELLKQSYCIDDSATLSTRDVVNYEEIDDAPTIIEADKVEREENYDELSKEDRAIIKDAARNIACMNGISCEDAEYAIRQALEGMSEHNLL